MWTIIEILWAGLNYITGSMPEELSDLARLRKLGIDTNALSGSIPESIGKAVSIGTSRVSKHVQNALFFSAYVSIQTYPLLSRYTIFVQQ